MRIQPGEVYRIQWPYDVTVEKEPYAIVVSEESFNDQHVIVVPLFTENLSDPRLDSPCRRKSSDGDRGAHGQANAAPRCQHQSARGWSHSTIEEEVFFDLNLASAKAIGAHFFPGEFEAGWKTARQQTA